MIENATLLTGDCREVLKTLPDESVHCVVTSPPYLGLRDYGAPASIWGGDPDCKHWWKIATVKAEVGKGNWTQGINGRGEGQPGGVDAKREPIRSERPHGTCKCGAWKGALGSEPTFALYLEHVVEVFKEVWRVLRKDGTVFINLGDSYANDRRWGGATGGKHAKGLHGSQIGRAKRNTGFKAKDRMGQPHRIVFALQDAGWFFRDEWVWSKLSPMPGSQRDRATVAHEFVFMFTKKAKYFYDIEAIAEPVTGGAHGRGSKGVTPRSISGPAGSMQNPSYSAAVGAGGLVDTRYPRSVVQFAAQPFTAEMCTGCRSYYHDGAGHLPKHGEGLAARPICRCGRWDAWLSHYASFPVALPDRCIRAGTSEAGCCADCGAPWARVVEKVSKRKTPAGWDTSNSGHTLKTGRYTGKGAGVDLRHTPDQASRPPNGRTMGKHRAVNPQAKARVDSGSHDPPFGQTLTLGWVPTCKCLSGDPIPCTVLDLFNGTGRSGLAALRLGRRYIGIDVKDSYIELSRNYLTEELKHPPMIQAILATEAEQLELNL